MSTHLCCDADLFTRLILSLYLCTCVHNHIPKYDKLPINLSVEYPGLKVIQLSEMYFYLFFVLEWKFFLSSCIYIKKATIIYFQNVHFRTLSGQAASCMSIASDVKPSGTFTSPLPDYQMGSVRQLLLHLVIHGNSKHQWYILKICLQIVAELSIHNISWWILFRRILIYIAPQIFRYFFCNLSFKGQEMANFNKIVLLINWFYDLCSVDTIKLSCFLFL